MTKYKTDNSLIEFSRDISSREIIDSLGNLLGNRLFPYDAAYDPRQPGPDFSREELLKASEELGFMLFNIKRVQNELQQRSVKA